MSADPHLLPDGSTSWGPDPERHRNEGPGGCVPWEEVESLREQLEAAKGHIERFGMERNEEREKVRAAEARLARVHQERDEYTRAMEAKLAEERRMKVQHCEGLLARANAAEARLAERVAWERENSDAHLALTEKLGTKLAEVEKERDELLSDKEGAWAVATADLRAKQALLERVDRARELAEVDGLTWPTAIERLAEIARILSGDE